MSEHSEVPIIGRDIPWDTIKQQYCRVKHFTFIAVVESGKVKAPSPILPYASLLVESPFFFKEASLPVLHKLDFRNLWEVFMERKVYGDTRDYGAGTEMEVLVVYDPLKRRKLTKFLPQGFLPSLLIELYPKGTLERFTEKPEPGKAEEWFNLRRPIAVWDARPENLK